MKVKHTKISQTPKTHTPQKGLNPSRFFNSNEGLLEGFIFIHLRFGILIFCSPEWCVLPCLFSYIIKLVHEIKRENIALNINETLNHIFLV